MTNSPEDAPRYAVVTRESYDSDRDDFYLPQNRVLGPYYADRWLNDLDKRVADPTGFPGPLSHARDDEASDLYGREVRRLLYYGPTRRRSGTPVRVLFTILPPAPDDPLEAAELVILLLRLLRGTQTLAPDDPA